MSSKKLSVDKLTPSMSFTAELNNTNKFSVTEPVYFFSKTIVASGCDKRNELS